MAQSRTPLPDPLGPEMRRAHAMLGEVLGFPEPKRPRCLQDLRDGKRYVYFIAGEGTPVKIGSSKAPYERLATLQTAHWVPLQIIAKVEGSEDDERAYHRRFAADRLVGEWFTRTAEINDEINRLRPAGRQSDEARATDAGDIE